MEKISRQDALHLESYVEGCEDREEQLVVILRNLKTGEEVEVPVSPHFLAQLIPYV